VRILVNLNEVFPIGLGGMPLSVDGRPSLNDAMHVVDAFVSAGGNFIDTADVYGLDEQDKGHNEKLLHRILRQLGYRDEVIVATKGGANRPNGGWELRNGHPDNLRKSCEQSLRNLNVEAHTLYYLHGPDPAVTLEDSIGELTKLQQEGKIVNIGIANVSLSQLKRAACVAKITAVQNRCNLFCKGDLNNGVIEYCKENAMSYIPYHPLGGWMNHANLARSSLSRAIVKIANVSYYTLCLAWLLSKGDHVIPIPGMDKVEHIESNFSALNMHLSQEIITLLDSFPDTYHPAHVSI